MIVHTVPEGFVSLQRSSPLKTCSAGGLPD